MDAHVEEGIDRYLPSVYRVAYAVARDEAAAAAAVQEALVTCASQVSGAAALDVGLYQMTVKAALWAAKPGMSDVALTAELPTFRTDGHREGDGPPK